MISTVTVEQINRLFLSALSPEERRDEKLYETIPAMIKDIEEMECHHIAASKAFAKIAYPQCKKISKEVLVHFQILYVIIFSTIKLQDQITCERADILANFPDFTKESSEELELLMSFHKWVLCLKTLIGHSLQNNVDRVLKIATRLSQGHGVKYITGGGPTRQTRNRLTIIRVEGGVVVNKKTRDLEKSSKKSFKSVSPQKDMNVKSLETERRHIQKQARSTQLETSRYELFDCVEQGDRMGEEELEDAEFSLDQCSMGNQPILVDSPSQCMTSTMGVSAISPPPTRSSLDYAVEDSPNDIELFPEWFLQPILVDSPSQCMTSTMGVSAISTPPTCSSLDYAVEDFPNDIELFPDWLL